MARIEFELPHADGTVALNTGTQMDYSVVDTPRGKLQGRRETGVIAFKGVPFAARPFGENRLQPPQPTEETRLFLLSDGSIDRIPWGYGACVEGSTLPLFVIDIARLMQPAPGQHTAVRRCSPLSADVHFLKRRQMRVDGGERRVAFTRVDAVIARGHLQIAGTVYPSTTSSPVYQNNLIDR